MALIACACITAGAAFNIARDGGPPREGARAEVSPPPASRTAESSASVTPRDAVSEVPDMVTTGTPALTIVELERLLAASDRAPERQAALIDVSLTVAETDPGRAVNLRESEVGNVEPDGVLEAIVQRWAERNFESALAWTNAQPASDQRDKLLQRLVYVRATTGEPIDGLE